MSVLSGCAIAVFGKFPGYTQAKLKVLITENGAKFENGISSTCTHLIAPGLTISSNDKVNAVLAKKIPIVSLKWLTDSINEGKKLAESPYLHGDGKASSCEQIHSDMKKRKGDEPEETVENPTKKPKAQGQKADAEMKQAVDQEVLMDEPVEEAETEKRLKRGRGGLKSKEVQEPARFNTKKSVSPTKNAPKPGCEAEDIVLEDADLTKDRNVETKSSVDTKKTSAKEIGSAGPQASLAMGLGESSSDLALTKAKAKNIHVPVTPWCEQRSWCIVYIDPSGMPYDASLSQTNIGDGKNNNKYYNIQLLESRGNSNYAIWTQWGRVGEEGQQALHEEKTLGAAMKIFEKKFREKTGLKWENRYDTPKARKYTLIEKNYMDSEDEDDGIDERSKRRDGSSGDKLAVHSTLSPELQSLMKLIFNTQYIASSMEDMRYNANKLPLGKLSKRTLSQGFMALKDLDEILTDINLAQSKYKQPLSRVLEQLTSKYYTVIPHDFGWKRPPIIDNADTLKKEVELVEALSNMEITNEIMNDAQYPVDASGNPINPLDKQFRSLGLEEINLVEKSTIEYAELEAYFRKSQRHSTHVYVVDIFRITRPGEAERFEKSWFSAKDVKKMHSVNDARKLLWHGSRSTNFGGILSQGLRIAPPEAPVNGYAFGKGIYLADVSSKSCEYVYPSTSGGLALILLCEAQLGDPPYERHLHCSDAANQSKASGSISTWAKGVDQPRGWKDAGAISEEFKGVKMMDVGQGMYKPVLPSGAWIPDNEYIVYSIAQIKLQYLFKVQFSYH